MTIKIDQESLSDSMPLEFDLSEALKNYSREELEKMRDAGAMLEEHLRLLVKSGENMVGQCLANQGTFFEEEHYPQGDVYDPESHAQYYYHAHRPESGEHGHFHTFLRAKGMKANVKPVPYKGEAKRPKGKDALSHIVAVSMDGPGFPFAIFTTNRWVTDETFYKASDVVAMIDRFVIEQSYPCLATNRGITAILRLFKPQIEGLLEMRDEVIQAWGEKYPDRDVFEDRELEITSILNVNKDKQISAIKKALRG